MNKEQAEKLANVIIDLANDVAQYHIQRHEKMSHNIWTASPPNTQRMQDVYNNLIDEIQKIGEQE